MESSSRSGMLTAAMLRVLPVPQQRGWPHWVLLACQLWAQWVVYAAIDRAAWSTGTDILMWTAVSAVVGVTLIVWHLPEDSLSLYVATLGMGLALMVWLLQPHVAQAVANELGDDYVVLLQTYSDTVNEVLLRGLRWGRALAQGESSNDPILFALTLGMLTFVVAGMATWTLLRQQQTWLSIGISALPLFINYTLAPTSRSDSDIVLFAGIAFAIVLCNHIALRQEVWQSAHIDHSSFAPLQSTWHALLIIVPVIAIASQLPLPPTNETALRIWATVRAPFTSVRNGWDQVFGSAITNQAGGFSLAGMQVGGARNRSQQEVLRIRTSRPDYVRATSYNHYTGQGWSNTLTRTETDLVSPRFITSRVQGRTAVVSTVTIRRDRSDALLLTVGDPVNFGRDARLYAIADTELTIDSLLASTSRDALLSGNSYTVTALVSTANETQLRTTIPPTGRIQQIYTELPAELPERIAELSTQIVVTAGAQTPYDEAVTIQNYLRQFTYNERRTRPPTSVDWVDYMVFEAKQGYCDDFATAMTVMLRTRGIPARYVQGYTLGSRDPVSGEYVVREAMAHSWVEVYFDDYGWQRFEPTPAGYVEMPDRRPPATTSDSTTERDPVNSDTTSSAERPDSLERFEPPSASESNLPPDTPAPTSGWIWLLLAACTSISGSIGYWWWHRQSPAWHIQRHYRTLCVLLQWATIPLPGNVTPLQVRRTVAEHNTALVAHIELFLVDYQHFQYAANKPTTWHPIAWRALIAHLLHRRWEHLRTGNRSSEEA